MNNRPITDKNVNFNQAKIIEAETNDQKRLKSFAENIARVCLQHNAFIIPVIEIAGNEITGKLRYGLKQREQ